MWKKQLLIAKLKANSRWTSLLVFILPGRKPWLCCVQNSLAFPGNWPFNTKMEALSLCDTFFYQILLYLSIMERKGPDQIYHLGIFLFLVYRPCPCIIGSYSVRLITITWLNWQAELAGCVGTIIILLLHSIEREWARSIMDLQNSVYLYYWADHAWSSRTDRGGWALVYFSTYIRLDCFFILWVLLWTFWAAGCAAVHYKWLTEGNIRVSRWLLPFAAPSTGRRHGCGLRRA